MSIFTVPISVGHPNGGDLYPLDAVVDTGAAHSMLPASLLADLSVPAEEELGFILADGNRVRYRFWHGACAVYSAIENGNAQ